MLTMEQCIERFTNGVKEYRQKQQRPLQPFCKDYTIPGSSFRISIHFDPPGFKHQAFHNHDCFEMIYVYQGELENEMPANRCTLHQGDILLLNPNVWHNVYRNDEKDIAFNIAIPKELFQTYLSNILEDNQMFSFFFSDYLYRDPKSERYLYFQNSGDPWVREPVERMVREYFSKQPNWNSMTLACLIALFSQLSRTHQEESKIAAYENDRNRIVYEMVAYVNAHMQNVTLNQMAEHLKYSPGHLSKLLRKSGKNFSQLLLECRMNKAGYYLEHTNLPISEIIERIGYTNEFHFYKLFRQSFHTTPTEYRKSVRS